MHNVYVSPEEIVREFLAIDKVKGWNIEDDREDVEFAKEMGWDEVATEDDENGAQGGSGDGDEEEGKGGGADDDDDDDDDGDGED
jgi:hypothetical protein